MYGVFVIKEISVKYIMLLGVMFCNTLASCSSDLSRDLFAYNYHAKQLKKTWISDSIVSPACSAAVVGIVSLLSTLYILRNSVRPDDLLHLSAVVGACAFLSSWGAFMVLKGTLRLFIKNSYEESLNQSLSIIALKLKTAIADGDITLDDLEFCGANSDCPLMRELVEYARAFDFQERIYKQV